MKLGKAVRNKLIALFAMTAIFASLAFSMTTSSVKTDLNAYPEPPLPSLPPAGGKFIDSVFGSEIMRVTDERDGSSAGTAYSYWSTFNKDNTKLLIQADNSSSGAIIATFNPNTFALGGKEIPPQLPTGGYFSSEFAIWSGTNKSILFGVGSVSNKLWEYNVETHNYSLLHDFAANLAAGNYLWQMSRSVDDNIFAFTVKNSSYETVGFIAYRRSTNEILYNRTTSVLDEVQIDKSGRYLVYKTGEQGVGKIQVEIIDLLDNSVIQLTDDAPDFAPGHSDNGNGMIIGADNWQNRLTFRNLATPHTFKTVFDFKDMWDVSEFHVSQLADNERWTLLSFYSNPASGLFRRELVQIATDGSQRVRRFAHHRSMSNDYSHTPRANISRDGNFVAFTSDWGGRSRTDLFIAKVPAESTSVNVLNPVTWQNIQNTIINGGTVQHSQAGYMAIAKTQEVLSGAGSFEFVYDGKRYSAGLGKSGGVSILDFELNFYGTYADIKQGGVYVGEITGLSNGSVISVKIASNGDVIFSKNNVAAFTIPDPPKSYPYPLVFGAQNEPPLGQSIINAKFQSTF